MSFQIFFALCFISFALGLSLLSGITEIVSPKVSVGFSPVWSDDTRSLYWVDWYHTGDGAPIFRYSYDDNKVYQTKIGGSKQIAFIALVEGSRDRFVVGLDHDVSIIEWDGISSTARIVKTLFGLEKEDFHSRTSYARPDRMGRLYVGTISDQFCSRTVANRSMYRYTPEEGVVHMFNGTFTTSGIAINEKINKFYHLDTCGLVVTQFDYDPKTGDLSNRQIAFYFRIIGKRIGLLVPDGMDIDSNGLLYIPDYQNTFLYVINPQTKSLVYTNATSHVGIAGAGFGGPQHNILYLTDGSLIINVLLAISQDRPHGGGYLFARTGIGANGLKPTYFRI